jgi:hypothetical protein
MTRHTPTWQNIRYRMIARIGNPSAIARHFQSLRALPIQRMVMLHTPHDGIVRRVIFRSQEARAVQLLWRSELFDHQFYAAQYPDVPNDRLGAAQHYWRHGAAEGRRPNDFFDGPWYLQSNPDVAAAGANPLVHYLTLGEREGRRTSPPSAREVGRLKAAAVERLRAATAAHARAKSIPTAIDLRAPLTESELLTALKPEQWSSQGIVIAIRHDDYGEHTGGVQLLIDNEREAATASGFQYLHVSPASPLPIVVSNADNNNVRILVSLGRQKIGVTTATQLAQALRKIVAAGSKVDIVIHHLMGHSLEAISELLIAAQVPNPLLWVHDYFTICTDYTLMRNDIEFCSAPPPSSNACTICCYGEERGQHLSRMTAFFVKHSPVVLAPSAAALEIWRRGGLPCSSTAIQPPAQLLPVQPGMAPRFGLSDNRPVRVAHLGITTYLKGWHVFEDLALARAADSRYEFLHFGTILAPDAPENIRHVDAKVSGQQPLAMVEALVREQVDVVICWPMAAETYSFTAHEALAAGAFIVARRGAGNVWPAVTSHPPVQGLALDTQRELSELLAGDALHKALQRAERFYRPLIHGGGTVDHLLQRRNLKGDAKTTPSSGKRPNESRQ